MTYDPQSDDRLDPRLKAVLAMMPTEVVTDAESRDQLLAEAASPEGVAEYEMATGFMDMADDEAVAPSKGLALRDRGCDVGPGRQHDQVADHPSG